MVKNYNAAYTHIHTLPAYQSRLLPMDKPSGKTRLQQEIDLDVVFKSYIKDYGKPDYLYVDSRFKVYAMYRSPEKFVTFTRSYFKPTISEVEEALTIPPMFKGKMPPLDETAKENVLPQINKALSVKVNENPSPKITDSTNKPILPDKVAPQEDILQHTSKTTSPKIDKTQKDIVKKTTKYRYQGVSGDDCETEYKTNAEVCIKITGADLDCRKSYSGNYYQSCNVTLSYEVVTDYKGGSSLDVSVDGTVDIEYESKSSYLKRTSSDYQSETHTLFAHDSEYGTMYFSFSLPYYEETTKVKISSKYCEISDISLW